MKVRVTFSTLTYLPPWLTYLPYLGIFAPLNFFLLRCIYALNTIFGPFIDLFNVSNPSCGNSFQHFSWFFFCWNCFFFIIFYHTKTSTYPSKENHLLILLCKKTFLSTLFLKQACIIFLWWRAPSLCNHYNPSK